MQENEDLQEQEPTHMQRALELKATLEKVIINLDPSYGEIDEEDIDLYITVLEHALHELNELSEEFD